MATVVQAEGLFHQKETYQFCRLSVLKGMYSVRFHVSHDKDVFENFASASVSYINFTKLCLFWCTAMPKLSKKRFNGIVESMCCCEKAEGVTKS